MNEKILVKGIEHFVEHRKKRITELVDPNQEWNHESEELPAKMARIVAEGLNEEVKYFEEILKLAEQKKTTSIKRTKKPS